MKPGAVELWFPFRAVSKGRPRLGRRRKAFTPQKTKDFESAVAQAYRDAGLPNFGSMPMTMEVDVHQEGFMVRLVPAECSVRPIGVRGDLDNLQKAISDGLNGIAYDDDRRLELVTIGFVGVPRKGTEYDESTLDLSDVQASDVGSDRTQLETAGPVLWPQGNAERCV